MNPFAALFASLPPNHSSVAVPQSVGPVDPKFAGLIAKLQGQPGAPTIGGSFGESLGEFPGIDDFGDSSGELGLALGTPLTAPPTIPGEFLQIANIAGSPVSADSPVSRPVDLTLAPPPATPESTRLQNPTIPAPSPATRVGIPFETPPVSTGNSIGDARLSRVTPVGGDGGISATVSAATQVELPDTVLVANAQSRSTIPPATQTPPETLVSPAATPSARAADPIVRTGRAEITFVHNPTAGVESRQIAPSTEAIPRSSLPIELEGFEPVVPTPRTSSPAGETPKMPAPSALAPTPVATGHPTSSQSPDALPPTTENALAAQTSVGNAAKTAPEARIKTGAALRPAAPDIAPDRRNRIGQPVNERSGYLRHAVASPKKSGFTPADYQQVAAKIGFATQVAGSATQSTYAPLTPNNFDVETRLENAFPAGRSIVAPDVSLPPATASQTTLQPLTNPTTPVTHTPRVDVPPQPVPDQVALQVR